jgi:hypothetical protein
MEYSKTFKVENREIDFMTNQEKDSYISDQKGLQGGLLGTEIGNDLDWNRARIEIENKDVYKLELVVFKKVDWDNFIREIHLSANITAQHLINQILR